MLIPRVEKAVDEVLQPGITMHPLIETSPAVVCASVGGTTQQDRSKGVTHVASRIRKRTFFGVSLGRVFRQFEDAAGMWLHLIGTINLSNMVALFEGTSW